MPSTQAEIPQFALPFAMTATGREAVVEQGTVEEMRQHAAAAARVRHGDLAHDPSLGTTDQTGAEGGIDLTLLEAELSSCDPRPTLDLEQAMSAAREVMVTVTVGKETT